MTAATKDRSTTKMEVKAGRENTPDFAWPTVLLTVGLLLTFAGSCFLALTGRLPYWAAAAVNTVVIYAIYTPVHEAIHGNISSRRQSLRWIDRLCGTLCCFPLWLFIDQHRKQHSVHHARANHDDDPDIYARGSFLAWLFVRLPWSLVNYFNPWRLYRECKAYGVTPDEMRRVFATFALSVAVVAGLVAAGHGHEVLVLWFVPWWIGQSVMLTFFTWTPHHDHRETGRYRDTRISEWPGGNVLLLGQGYHLIHHMMPAVPWYRYKATFEQIRPILEAKGARIEGFWPHPHRDASASAR